MSVETLMKLPVTEIVNKHRPADRRWPGLTFDIAETQALSKMSLLKSKFPELEKCGISVALDNLGRGNCSFEMFRHLRFAELKIDRSFVRGCAEDAFQAKVCKSVVQLAHNFGCKASAVGVETNIEAIALQDLGCDYGQGFLFDRPMPEQDLLVMARQLATVSQSNGSINTAGTGA